MSMVDGSQGQVFEPAPDVFQESLEQLSDAILRQKLADIQTGVTEQISAVGEKVIANGTVIGTLNGAMDSVQQKLDAAIASQADFQFKLQSQGLWLGAALVLVAVITVVTWFLQHRKLDRACKDILSLEDQLLKAASQVQRGQEQADRREPYPPAREPVAGIRSAAGRYDNAGAHPSQAAADPVKRFVDPVQEILARLNGILRKTEYANKMFRLVLSQVEQVEGLQAFELEGTYFGDTSGKISLVPTQREAFYFGYFYNGALYVFPNYSVLDISQAPDRIFDGYRRHEPIASVLIPALFVGDKGDRWILQRKGQIA